MQMRGFAGVALTATAVWGLFSLALAACVTCPDNSFCPPTSLAGCICLAGYTGNDNDNCTGALGSMD